MMAGEAIRCKVCAPFCIQDRTIIAIDGHFVGQQASGNLGFKHLAGQSMPASLPTLMKGLRASNLAN